ncbi:ECF transporter S component [Leucobacter sp. wl10]|uniref:ECF transporter S component n=1 Tax=Leucobacter sp. wl10 TaxID=2304677 RepID=UPI000E5B4CB0|nr:ECF transporter S component [Leucobacter sp. wl10]RGE21522.1 hypothetical protein D1J51_06725 [Leucobacter sp. wl10]
MNTSLSASRISTRVLLTTAAIGVVGGIVNIPNAYAFNAVAALVPWATGFLAGFYVLPGFIALALLRRGGVGLGAELVAGLVAVPFVPGGIASMIPFLALGILMEAPFLMRRYRGWESWFFIVVGALMGVVYGSVWIPFYGDIPVWQMVMIPVSMAVSVVVFVVIALLIARGVERTGVVRGLRRGHR